MKYRGYTIKKEGEVYRVITPTGEKWAEVAVNRATAKRWIDAHICDRGLRAYTTGNIEVGSRAAVKEAAKEKELRRNGILFHVREQAKKDMEFTGFISRIEPQDREKVREALLYYAETGAVRALEHPEAVKFLL